MKELSAKQKKFVHEWLIDLCGTRAAIRAGYSEKSAAQTASRLMKDPAVREYRDALLKEEFDSLGITRHSLAVEVWRVYELERIERSEGADAADGYETMLSGGGREF